MVEMAVLTLFTLVFADIATSSKSSMVILAENGKKSSITINTGKSEAVIDKPNSYMKLSQDKQSEIKEISEEELYKRFKNVISHTPKKPVSILLYFKKGTNVLTDDSKHKIDDILKEIKSRKSVDLNVIGHTDTVGSSKINAKLSLKRAAYIKDMLVQKKIKYNSLEVSSYGENDLLVQTKDNVAEPKNRRVEVFIK